MKKEPSGPPPRVGRKKILFCSSSLLTGMRKTQRLQVGVRLMKWCIVPQITKRRNHEYRRLRRRGRILASKLRVTVDAPMEAGMSGCSPVTCGLKTTTAIWPPIGGGGGGEGQIEAWNHRGAAAAAAGLPA